MGSLSSSILAPVTTVAPTTSVPRDTTPPETTESVCDHDGWVFESDGDIGMHIFLRHFILQEVESTILGVQHKKYCMNMG